jgi:hypothetical protein
MVKRALEASLAGLSAGLHQAARIRFHLSGDAALVDVGNHLLLMAQGGQRYFELPRWMERLWPQLENVSDDFSLRWALVDHLAVTADDAELMALELLRNWSLHGLATLEMIASAPFPYTFRFCLAARDIVLSFDDEDTAKIVRPLFAHVSCSGVESDLCVSVRRMGDFVLVTHHGAKTALVRLAETGPAIKGMILEAMLADRQYPLALHAACVVLDERAILLVGPSGAGKTLFSLAAADQGFAYCADDVVLVDEQARIRGVPFAPAIKASGWAFADGVENFANLDTHLRLDGVSVRYPPPPHGFVQTPLPIGATILLDRRSDGLSHLNHVDPLEAFVALLSEASAPLRRISAADCQTLANMITARPSYRLCYSEVRDAAAMLYRALYAQDT